MVDFIRQLDNRELSLIIWIIIVIVLVNISPSIRKSFLNVLVALLNKHILSILGLIILFTYVVIQLLKSVNFWEPGLIKETLFWMIGSGFVWALQPTKLEKGNFASKYIKQTISLALVIEFFNNFYVFNLIIELLILPVLFFIGALIAYVDVYEPHKPENIKVKKFLNRIAAIVGFFLLFFGLYHLIQNPHSLINFFSGKEFLVPIIFGALLLPVLIMIGVYTKYELLFVVLGFRLKEDKELLGYAKWMIFKNCLFNVKKILFIHRNLYLYEMNDRNQIADFTKGRGVPINYE